MWHLLGACCIPRLQAGCHFLRPKLVLATRSHPVCTALSLILLQGAEEVCCRKKPTFVVLPKTGSVFLRSVQRTATSRPQPIRIRGKVREADSLPDTRGRIVSSKNKRYDYPSYIYFDRGARIQIPHHLFDRAPRGVSASEGWHPSASLSRDIAPRTTDARSTYRGYRALSPKPLPLVAAS